jgi:glycine/D-amino acid oxidase-like deaminating enzyme
MGPGGSPVFDREDAMKTITELDDDCVWHATAVPAPDLPVLEGDVSADVAIVGGGYTGLVTALRLAERGHDAVVVEAKQVGFGGSGRNAGHCTPTFHFWSYEKIRRMYGAEYADRLTKMQTGAADQVFGLIESYQIECEAVRNGILRLAASPAHLDYLAKQKAFYERHGLKGRMLDAVEAEDLSGSPHYHGAWLLEAAGHLNPLGYSRGLARAALSQGARIYIMSPAEGMARDGAGWRIRTPKGSVTAERVLLATGAYTVGPPWPGLTKAFDNVPLVGLATKPLDPALRKEILKGDHSMVDTQGDPVLYKWTKTNRLVTTVFFAGPMGHDVERTKDFVAQRSAWVFPALGKVEWPHYWYGLLDGQYRTIPRVFKLDEGVYSCLGFSGRGVPTATAMGAVLAELLGGGDPSKLSVPVEPFRRVLPGLARLQAMQMAWHRFRDRRQMKRDGITDLPPVM